MLPSSVLPFAAAFLAMPLQAADDAPIDYTRDIKPILASQCYSCHGPDEGKRKARLRLDERDAAIKKAIKPGDSAKSPLIERLVSKEADEVMPPPSAKKPPLTPAQIDLLKRWIDQGAKFDVHWAYVKPTRPTPPAATGDWAKNPIDRFVAAKRQAEKLPPAPEADRITLTRRLYFDLLGLPPTPAEVDVVLKDTSANWYEKLVDRLLASKHYGERMAIYWLDLVRFADTAGYHSDNHRDLWLYREYVIDAFNNNKPFDRFTIEQLAGDLLPNATKQQVIASGYNRLLQTTEEGGAQAKEYTAKYAADRVRNISVVWFASTMGCAECHNHKFDPFTMKDFYSLASFFADIKEKAVGRQDQTPLPTPAQAAQLQELDGKIAQAQQRLNQRSLALDEAQAYWELGVQGGETKGVPKPILDALAVLSEKRSPKQRQDIDAYFRTIAPELKEPRNELADLQKQKDALLKAVPSTLVSMSGPARTMRILPRGNWLDDSGEAVQPAVPASLGALEVKGRPTRLDLAHWLVSPDHPLTARVFVNRLWKLSFGQGLVRSLEDFGIQSTPPTHPELLDWLAVEFASPSPQPSPAAGEGATAWNIKKLHKLILMSATYRQSSVAPKEVRDRDPGNLWLARQGRFRLDAELVRDNALAVSGLLVKKIGGPSVKPYQPAGYWQFLNFPKRDWAEDKGEDQYRRGMYTYWQRSFLHPSLLAFDAPSREECTAERPRSSTPLQALVLLNDPTYVEAARAFAERIVQEGGASVNDRLNWAYRQAVSRPIKPEEAKVLTALVQQHLEEYTADPKAAQQLLGTGQKPAPQGLPLPELAAWTSVARVILNLHETITRN
ncbi:MAG: PSD1 domain-containing protein [Planctomycetia bacterium]|nr:PSD1 domain-containing protein [Planctomycetia bacterium]